MTIGQWIINIILILIVVKSVMIGSEYNFWYLLKYGKTYSNWYKNKPTFKDYINGQR